MCLWRTLKKSELDGNSTGTIKTTNRMIKKEIPVFINCCMRPLVMSLISPESEISSSAFLKSSQF